MIGDCKVCGKKTKIGDIELMYGEADRIDTDGFPTAIKNFMTHIHYHKKCFKKVEKLL